MYENTWYKVENADLLSVLVKLNCESENVLSACVKYSE